MLLAALLLPFAVVLGIEVPSRYNVKAEPYVSIRSQGRAASLTGAISIENVKLQPVGLTEVIPIEEI